MKLCEECHQENTRPRASICKICYTINSRKKFYQKHKVKILERQKIYGEQYRKNNRQLCIQRSRACDKKNKDKYLIKRRENYRKKRGIPIDDPFRKRKDGEGNIDSNGYKTITKRGHPNQMDKKGRIREHIYVMTEHLGRPLKKGESVHHKNGDRQDNRIENLELWSRAQPPGQRVEDKIAWYIEFLRQYGYSVKKEILQ